MNKQRIFSVIWIFSSCCLYGNINATLNHSHLLHNTILITSCFTDQANINMYTSENKKKFYLMTDTDGDGVDDDVDIDDDNDGILDSLESGIYDEDGDEDGDGILNYLDTTDDGSTGDGSTTDYTDSNSDGIPDVYDLDGDGVPNHLDLDTDGDGIPDNVEAQSTSGYLTPSGTDTDGDGLDDQYDSDCAPCGSITGEVITPISTDSGGDDDYKDTDSDDDGNDDKNESGLTLTGTLNINGLDTGVYATDDYTDVNGSLDDPTLLQDIDLDVQLDGGDVDYRDDEFTINSGKSNLLWLKGDVGITTNTSDEVTIWNSQALVDYPAQQSGTSNIPSYLENGLNFNPTVNFDGDNFELLAIRDLFDNSQYYNDLWIYCVNSSTDITDHKAYVFSWGRSSDGNRVYLQTPDREDFEDDGTEDPEDTTFQVGGGSSPLQYEWGTIADDNLEEGNYYLWNVGSSTKATSTPSGTNRSIYFNGELALTDSTKDSIASGGSWSNATIGAQNATTSNAERFMSGGIAELIVFTEAPTALEQQKVQSYLAIKYGITLRTEDNLSITEGDYILSDTITKIWDYSQNSDYHNRITGIGRDDVLGLEQKQSLSIEDGGLVTIGLGSIASDNSSNTNTFESDKDFLVFGDNNGLVSTTSPTTLCSSFTRLNRIWKIVETGSVGDVQVMAPATIIEAVLPITGSEEYVVLIADDEDFTENLELATLTSQTINSEDVYAATFDFDETKFFTIGYIDGIRWRGSTEAWSGGSGTDEEPDTTDDTKLAIIDSQETENHAVLTDSVKVGCLWITKDSKLIVPTEKFIGITDEFVLRGELRLEGTAQLLQTHTSTSKVTGSGKLYIDQEGTAETIYRYNYWSSPVTTIGETTYTVGDVLKDGTTPTSETSTPLNIEFIEYDGGGDNSTTYDGDYTSIPIKIANHWIYSLMNSNTRSGWAQKKDIETINPGEGFTMKGPGAVQNYTFVGTPNDGEINVDISGGYSSLLGNPYPSSIDANEFFNDNSSVVNALYFWQHTGDSGDHQHGGYEGGYGVRNAVMGTAPTSGPSSEVGLGSGSYSAPGQYIPVAQGFFAEATTSGGTVSFKNSQRIFQEIDGSSTIFFRSNNKKKKTGISILKIGVNYINGEGIKLHRQLGVSFIKGHSFAHDNGYDSSIFDLDITDAYFKFEGNDNKYVIAGIQEITDELEFPISFKIGNEHSIEVMIDTTENIDRNIYLIDKVAEEEYDLSSSIELELEEGTYEDRFYISFGKTLNVDEELKETTKIYYSKPSREIIVETNSSLEIKKAVLFNLQGKKIKEWKDKNMFENKTVSKLGLNKKISSSIYILKLNTEKGIISKKVAIKFF